MTTQGEGIQEQAPADSRRAAPRAPRGDGAAERPARPRSRIVVLNQYYVPDVASTGYLLHELALELVTLGFPVSAVTSRPSYGPPESWVACPLRETLDGVEVRRLWTTRLSKDNLVGRAVNYVTFFVQLAGRMLLTSRPDRVHLYTTNPPFLGVIGALVSIFRRHRYVVLLHDSYPHLAVWVGTVKKGGFVERLWHRINRLAYRRAQQTIVLCEAAKRLVCEEYGVEPSRVHVIPNWADGATIRPLAKRESRFARDHGLVEPFTVLYSGNLGLYYEFETVLDAAQRLEEEPFRLVFIGSGGRKDWLQQQVRTLGLTNTTFHPYQPFDRLPDSLAACDASLVTIARGIEGISYPSKLYSSLAVGRPILAISEPDSEMRRLVEEHDVGRWFALGDAPGLAAGIRDMMADPERTDEQGRKARALFEREFTRRAAGRKYAQVLSMAAPATHGRAGR